MLATEITLEPKSYLFERVNGPLLSVFVAAERPMNLYIVDDPNFENYKSRREFVHYGPGPVRMFSSIFHHPGEWVVVLENPSEETATVDYSFT
jgi:hypothetical protein